MDMQPPHAVVQVAQAEVPPDAPVEPAPIEVNVSKYIPEIGNFGDDDYNAHAADGAGGRLCRRP